MTAGQHGSLLVGFRDAGCEYQTRPDAGGPDASVRPVSDADVAQARLFRDMLREEIAELEARLEAAEVRWTRRHRSDHDDMPEPDALVRLNGQLDEARRMSQALRERFPV
jgi:hypothetical protein